MAHRSFAVKSVYAEPAYNLDAPGILIEERDLRNSAVSEG